MYAKMANVWKRVQPVPVAGDLARSAADQTRSSWARLIESYAEVPAVYRSFFASLQAAGQSFPYTVRTPSYEGFINRETEKLVCVLDREIYILERKGDGFETRGYPLETISYVEVRTVLLDSRITFSGMTRDDVPATSTFRFNSVTDYLFAPLVEKIRRVAVGPVDVDLDSEARKFDDLIRTNYKFMNYGRRSLLGAEKVQSIILQPEIRMPLLTFLGKTYYRMVSPTHMSILTDRELILIYEEARRGSTARYGGTWQYIPLRKIEALTLAEKDAWLVLSVRLPHGVGFESLHHPALRQELKQLLACYESERRSTG